MHVRFKIILLAVAAATLAGAIYLINLAANPVANGVDRRALWDGRSDVRFRAVDSPEMVPAARADFIAPTDYVLGVTVAGQSRAYPSSYIGFHHIVNDRVAVPSGDPVWIAVTYCDVCGTGMVFDRKLDGNACELDFYGLYNGTIALCDRETQSVFLPNLGKFVTGPLLGKELKPGSLLDTTWSEWRRLHPDTLVMSPDESDRQYYAENGKHVRSMDAFPMEFFAPTVTRTDRRLPPFERILGVTMHSRDNAGNQMTFRRAYSFKSLQDSGGLIYDSLGGEPIAVFFDPKTVSAVVVSQKVNGVVYHFETRRSRDGAVGFYDRETGTRWSIEGRGEAGPLAGKNLTRIDAYLGEWYAWSAYFGDTSIYNRANSAESGTLKK